ncbi:DUF3862 domain-containing protein [Clostridium guangxiense]|uniref:DUF3862 domain-containing protein n=1 Tax=Clostridium guangxiense TaxID=1662055 RepID=UPI001E56015D|nr:DUF3862 domain-containing protein [Clostridium guangxiense]MCD2346810.1 DUF3862 domain-containing protein [Clostridium guangxiense]
MIKVKKDNILSTHNKITSKSFSLKSKIVITFAIIAIVTIFSLAYFVSKKNINVTSYTTTSKNERFMQVKMGMTYNQVKEILGVGKENVSTNTKTVIYIWQDSNTDISITLKTDRVINKARVLIKPVSANVTIDKYNKVNSGMTYNQVKKILGKGQLTSQSEFIAGDKSEIYSWINSNNSNATVTFQNGIVVTKSESNLK